MAKKKTETGRPLTEAVKRATSQYKAMVSNAVFEKTVPSASLDEVMKRMTREFNEFVSSDEGKARVALESGLQELIKNEVIRKSETCLEVLEAFHHCVHYNWRAKDSGGMISFLTPHFAAQKAAAAGTARAEKIAEKDAPHREFLALHADKKTEDQKKLLMAEFAITGGAAHDIVRRWKDSKERKKLTASSSRK